ncbi:MAG TPA: DUF58 domain-containing protein [Longimicrobiales bacterium]|nr:DUF58 domain-containing protein [Longimicrobiales bacterium]
MTHARARSDTPGAQFLDPQVLARIDNLELLARTVVHGFLNGLHRAPYLGLSMDFAEHRAYVPGDDVRHLDWRLFARSDRHYVKQYEAETNANVVALVDVSASMAYGSRGVTKLDYARFLSASLLHFSRGQRDRVGVVTFDDGIVEYVPPSARNLELALHTLARVDASAPGALRPSLLAAAERLSRRGIVILVSDFYEPADDVVEAVRLLRGRGHDVLAFHVLDPAEMELPEGESTTYRDMESGEVIPVIPARLRDGYRAQVEAHVATLRERFTAERVDYLLLDTSEPLDHALFRYLTIRERKARKR